MRALVDALDQRQAKAKATREMIADLKVLHFDYSSKAETEIASAADAVEQAEEMTEQIQEAGLANDVIEKSEAWTIKVQRELQALRIKWEAKKNLVQREIDLLSDEQRSLDSPTYAWT